MLYGINYCGVLYGRMGDWYGYCLGDGIRLKEGGVFDWDDDIMEEDGDERCVWYI